MKKLFVLALAALTSFSFISCGDDDMEPSNNDKTENTGNNGNSDMADKAEQAFKALKDNQININGEVLDLDDRFYYYETKDYLTQKVQGIHLQSEGRELENMKMARVNLDLGINWFGKNMDLLKPTINPNSEENKILIQVVKMYQMAEWPTHNELLLISANYSPDGAPLPGLGGYYNYLNADKTDFVHVDEFPLKRGNLNCWKEGTFYYVQFWGEVKNGEACAFKLKMDASLPPVWTD